jgi:hypothetical protein
VCRSWRNKLRKGDTKKEMKRDKENEWIQLKEQTNRKEEVKKNIGSSSVF